MLGQPSHNGLPILALGEAHSVLQDRPPDGRGCLPGFVAPASFSPGTQNPITPNRPQSPCPLMSQVAHSGVAPAAGVQAPVRVRTAGAGAEGHCQDRAVGWWDGDSTWGHSQLAVGWGWCV